MLLDVDVGCDLVAVIPTRKKRKLSFDEAEETVRVVGEGFEGQIRFKRLLFQIVVGQRSGVR